MSVFLGGKHSQLSHAAACTCLQATKVSPILTPNLCPLLPSVKPLTTAPLPSSTSSRISPSG